MRRGEARGSMAPPPRSNTRFDEYGGPCTVGAVSSESPQSQGWADEVVARSAGK